MSLPVDQHTDGSDPARQTRRYDSPVRRAQTAQTRERIVAAGTALVHSFPTWDWRGLTFRAVAERAGVSKRTVHRYFTTEGELHDAILRNLEKEAGVVYEGLDLDNLADTAAGGLATLDRFAASPGLSGEAVEPTRAADRRRREALARAVAPPTEEWTDTQRRMAAAILDILWTGHVYERLVTAWKLDLDAATGAVTWALDLLADGIREDHRPQPRPPAR
ncbi:Regulatory protein TetR [Frankia sp. Hr75.2]|nr:Regulatory protein TetR [Frankia sp. Hr75.2]